MVKKILMLYDEKQYDSLNFFVDELKKAFEHLGIEVDVWDCTGEANRKASDYTKKFDLAISFHGMYSRIYLDEKLKDRNIPVWSFMVEHPMYHYGTLLNDYRNSIVSFADRKHTQYVRETYNNHQGVCFMPPGGCLLAKPLKPWKERTCDVSFFGNYTSPDELVVEIQKLDEIMKNLMIPVIDKLILYDTATFEEEFEKALREKGIILSKNELRKELENYQFVDKYVRSIRQHYVIESVISQGIPVHVFGNGWKKFQSDYKGNLVVHENPERNAVIEAMADSRIVLNVVPMFSDGANEGVFTAIGAGSVCFSDRSIYLEDCFRDEEDIFFYSIDDLDSLPGKILSVLSGAYNVEAVIQNGYEKVATQHSWEKRAEEIVKYVETMNFQHEELIPIQNTVDYEFNQLMEHVKQMSYEQLYAKVCAKFHLLQKITPNFAEKMTQSFQIYSYWGSLEPEKEDFGVIADRVSYLKEKFENFLWLYQRLEDISSKKILKNILLNWESMFPKYLEECRYGSGSLHYFEEDIIHLQEDEVFVDLGSYIGDTVEEFLSVNLERYKRIYCYEFSKNNSEILKKSVEDLDNIIIRECAVGAEKGWVSTEYNSADSSADRVSFGHNGDIEVVTLDEDIQEKITFIKTDIEGAEWDALVGAKRHIQEDHPKLAISIYHGNKDILRIAELINSFDDSYRFYIRYYGSALYPNEFVLYAV